MTQYAVPDADITDGAYLDQAASNVDMYLAIVPGTPGSIGAGDDATYIQSPQAPVNEACAFNLSNVTDPLTATSHIMRWRSQKDVSGGAQIDGTIQLRQGYVSEGDTGTLINSFTQTDVANGWATQTDTLSGAEADAITDYTDLQMRVVANQV